MTPQITEKILTECLQLILICEKIKFRVEKRIFISNKRRMRIIYEANSFIKQVTNLMTSLDRLEAPANSFNELPQIRVKTFSLKLRTFLF